MKNALVAASQPAARRTLIMLPEGKKTPPVPTTCTMPIKDSIHDAKVEAHAQASSQPTAARAFDIHLATSHRRLLLRRQQAGKIDLAENVAAFLCQVP